MPTNGIQAEAQILHSVFFIEESLPEVLLALSAVFIRLSNGVPCGAAAFYVDAFSSLFR